MAEINYPSLWYEFPNKNILIATSDYVAIQTASDGKVHSKTMLPYKAYIDYITVLDDTRAHIHTDQVNAINLEISGTTITIGEPVTPIYVSPQIKARKQIIKKILANKE